MGGPDQPRADGDPVELADGPDDGAPPRAPALPIEIPLVRAVRALEALSAQTATLLFVLETAPRDDAQLTAAMNAAIARVNEASLALWHMQQVRSCEGQS